MADTTGQFRGFDAEGHVVIVGWVNADGTEYLIGLTKCCGADATGSAGATNGIACRACYEDCSTILGGQAVVVTKAKGKAVA